MYFELVYLAKALVSSETAYTINKSLGSKIVSIFQLLVVKTQTQIFSGIAFEGVVYKKVHDSHGIV